MERRKRLPFIGTDFLLEHPVFDVVDPDAIELSPEDQFQDGEADNGLAKLRSLPEGQFLYDCMFTDTPEAGGFDIDCHEGAALLGASWAGNRKAVIHLLKGGAWAEVRENELFYMEAKNSMDNIFHASILSEEIFKKEEEFLCEIALDWAGDIPSDSINLLWWSSELLALYEGRNFGDRSKATFEKEGNEEYRDRVPKTTVEFDKFTVDGFIERMKNAKVPIHFQDALDLIELIPEYKLVARTEWKFEGKDTPMDQIVFSKGNYEKITYGGKHLHKFSPDASKIWEEGGKIYSTTKESCWGNGQREWKFSGASTIQVWKYGDQFQEDDSRNYIYIKEPLSKECQKQCMLLAEKLPDENVWYEFDTVSLKRHRLEGYQRLVLEFESDKRVILEEIDGIWITLNSVDSDFELHVDECYSIVSKK